MKLYFVVLIAIVLGSIFIKVGPIHRTSVRRGGGAQPLTGAGLKPKPKNRQLVQLTKTTK